MQLKIIAVFVGIIVAVLVGGTTYASFETNNETIQKAVIIDQLYDDVPNDYFNRQARKHLENAGYQVDLYTTQNATVNFFKKLPSLNYQFIVIRAHALESSTDDNSVMIFTGEKYSEKKYITDQLIGHLKKGAPLLDVTFSIDEKNSTGWIQINETTKMITSPANFVAESDEYFLVSPQMITNGMDGTFPNSTVLLGGCSTLKNTSMAESFLKKGASEVVGWSDLVSSSDNDRAILRLLEKILVDEKSTENALDEVMDGWRSDPKYNSTMRYFTN